MSDRKDKIIKNEIVRDDISNVSENPSEYHEVEPYIKTPSPPVPIRDATLTPAESIDILSPTPSSVSSRLGQLEDQRKTHSEARKNQAAQNSITSLVNNQKTTASSKKPDKMISNSPEGHESDQEDEEVKKVLDSELVSDDEMSARDIESVVKAAYIDLLIVVPFIFFPTIFVYFCVGEPVDNIFFMKDPQFMTKVSEFFRYNIFATVAYGLYVIFDVLSLVVPEGILVFTPREKDNKATKIIREQLHVIINVRHNVAISAWLLTLVPWAGFILYESMFTTPWSFIEKIIEVKAEKKIADSDLAVQQNLLAYGKNIMMQRNIEIGLVLLAIFSSVLAIEKYLMQMVALSFHRMAFSSRISESNHQFSYLLKLYEAVKFGKPRVLSSTSSVNLLDIDSSADLSFDKGLHLTSVHRAKSVAKLIFRTLLPGGDSNRDYLVVEDFVKWTNHPQETFACLDLDNSGKLFANEIEEAVIEIYNTRDSLCRGLKSNGKIVKKLDGLFLFIAFVLGGILSSPIFDVGTGKLLAALGVLSTGFGFLFNSTAKSCFESLLFVFIQHPFDVGDRVLIDDENFVVDDIEIFTTKLIRWDGVAVYITNSTLCSKTILNIRRSDDQLESLALKLKGDTATESLLTFREELKKELQKDTSNFTGEVDFANLDKLPASNEPLALTVLAQVRGNFQNPAKRNARKTEFLAIVERALQTSNLTKA